MNRVRSYPALAFVLLFGLASAGSESPFFFIQLTDPQFGMYAGDSNFEQEIANFEFAMATAARLKPAFVIVTGDLVNKAADSSQIAAYLRTAARLDRSMPFYNVAGNHDVGNIPTPESIASYEAKFGPAHYSFRAGNMAGIVLNSTLIHSPQGAPEHFKAQDIWLSAELEKAKNEGLRHIVIFQHHPWFLDDPGEPDRYENIPRLHRRRYLDLFQKYGVTHLFSGHYHRDQVARYGAMELVTTGPIGKPLGKDKSGMRIVVVRETGIEHRYYEMGDIPNRIDPAR